MKKGFMAVLSTLAGAATGAMVATQRASAKTKVQKQYADKHLALYLMMNQWVKVKQENKSIADYLEKNGYQKIAIYGVSFAGETLANELRDTKTTIVYGIDQNADNLYADFDIYKPDDELPEVDAVVVTAIKFFDEIEQKLSEKMECPIISLEDILYEI